MTVHERIKIEAEKRGISISYITKEAEISASTINQWISNDINDSKGEPGANKLYRVASILNCSMEFLLTGKKAVLFDSLSYEEKNSLNLQNMMGKISLSELQDDNVMLLDSLSDEEQHWIDLYTKIKKELVTPELQKQCLHSIHVYIQTFINMTKEENEDD